MNSLTLVLFICSGLGGEGTTCNNHPVVVSPLVYKAVCIEELNNDSLLIDELLEGVAIEVESPTFTLESIDCLGE